MLLADGRKSGVHRGWVSLGVWQTPVDTSAKYFALLRQVHLAELATQLEDMVTTEPPVPVADAIALCKAQKAEWNLPEVEILKVRAGTAY